MTENSPRWEWSLVVVVDVRRFTASNDCEQAQVQRDLIDVLDCAGIGAGVNRATWRREPRGDSELAVIGVAGNASLVGAILDDYLVELAVALFRHNVRRPAATRMRLRLSVDCGHVEMTRTALAGGVISSAHRLLDSAPVRRILEDDPAVNLAVILSDRVRTDYVVAGHTALTDRDLRQVKVQVKDYDATAWVWSPEGAHGGTVPEPAVGPPPTARPAVHRWRATAVATAATAVAFLVLTYFWPTALPSRSGDRPTASRSTTTSRITVVSGDHLKVVTGVSGDGLVDADVDLHPRYRVGDQFVISPWGSARLSRSATRATMQSCVATLAQHFDVSLVITAHGVSDGGNLGVGDWMCLRVDKSTVAGIQVLSLSADEALPGDVGLGITVWKM